MTFKEPLIHWAIIHNEEEALTLMAKDETQLKCLNSLRYTPLETARFLGKNEIEEHLHETAPRQILIQKPQKKAVETISKEEFKTHFDVEYASSLRFRDYQSLKDTIGNMPLLFKINALTTRFRENKIKWSKQLDEGAVAKVSIRWINEEIGYGLFAEEPLLKGAWIGEYTGLVRQLWRHHQDHNPYCLHYPTILWSIKYHIVDSLWIGNELRFINHSDEPNLEPEYILDRGLLHFALFAKRDIKEGEQLFFDYGEAFWKGSKKKLKL